MTNLWIIISILLVLAVVAGVVIWRKGKRGEKHEPDYRTFFYIGVVWLLFGIIPDNSTFFILGLAFMAIGLVNKDKWKKKQELSKKDKIWKVSLIGGLLILVLIIGVFVYQKKNQTLQVTNFHECVDAGNAVMESYPRQCRHGGETFVENIGNELEKMDLIRIDAPRPNQTIKSPLNIEGQARGMWFFEGDFPVILTDWDGKIIAEGFATASENAMTEEFVPFSAVLEFETTESMEYKNNGTLILRKDNPSDRPDLDDALEVPIFFEM